MQSVVIAYMLTVALIIPASGWLADKFGIKRVFLFAIALFTAGSLACGLSPTLEVIVACRIIQGIGGALMVPVGRLVVLRAYPREQLVTVLSFITIPGLIGPLIGPTLGGFLVEYASWHWIFFINIPVGIIGILSTMKYMPYLARGGELYPFDRIGFILFSAFMLTITLGLEGIGELHLAYAPMVLLIVFGIVCLVGYVLYARYIPRPLFSPDLFRVRNFSVGILGNLFARLGNGAMPFLTPLLLQIGLGYSPMNAGLSMVPMTIGQKCRHPAGQPFRLPPDPHHQHPVAGTDDRPVFHHQQGNELRAHDGDLHCFRHHQFHAVHGHEYRHARRSVG